MKDSNERSKTAEEMFIKHFDVFRTGLHRASMDHYLETGKLSGNMLLSARECLKEYADQEVARLVPSKVKEEEIVPCEKLCGRDECVYKCNYPKVINPVASSQEETIEEMEAKFAQASNKIIGEAPVIKTYVASHTGGKIIIPDIDTPKNRILSRAMTLISEEDTVIGCEVFEELKSLMDGSHTEEMESQDELWMQVMVESHAIEMIGVSKVIRKLKERYDISPKI